MSSKTVKLYELPQREAIKIFAELSDGSTYVEFSHIDGMYSYCTTEKGGIEHLHCGTPLHKVDGGYEIAETVDKPLD